MLNKTYLKFYYLVYCSIVFYLHTNTQVAYIENIYRLLRWFFEKGGESLLIWFSLKVLDLLRGHLQGIVIISAISQWWFLRRNQNVETKPYWTQLSLFKLFDTTRKWMNTWIPFGILCKSKCLNISKLGSCIVLKAFLIHIPGYFLNLNSWL